MKTKIIHVADNLLILSAVLGVSLGGWAVVVLPFIG
jgi:hypothetical protein